jgi:pimeloyl-ACP methyl ester carboxylesterase
MATMILVAGAMHGAWVWDRVAPLLEAAGHKVVAIDLPGMGGDDSVALGDVTLELWAEAVAAQVRRAAQPVILGGHSRGGLVIGEAAERVPELVRGLIYIAALIVPPGETALSASQLDAALVSGPEVAKQALAAMSPERAIAGFYNCCTPQDAAWAASRLEPEPPAPIVTPSQVTWAGWGRLPRAYVECARDRTMTLDRQRLMQAAAPCDPVVQLDTDHSPFLSAPAELAETMLAVARTWGAC